LVGRIVAVALDGWWHRKSGCSHRNLASWLIEQVGQRAATAELSEEPMRPS
jgi:hypothetical protein